MTIASGHRRHNASTRALPQAPPGCSNCGTAASLSYDDFVPAHYSTDRQGLAPSVVSYTCRQCGSHYSHHGPDGWAPPDWQWYD